MHWLLHCCLSQSINELLPDRRRLTKPAEGGGVRGDFARSPRAHGDGGGARPEIEEETSREVTPAPLPASAIAVISQCSLSA